MAKNKIFSYIEFEEMLADTVDRREIAAIIIIAMGQWKDKKLTDFAYAGVLEKAASRIYSIK